MICPRRWKEGSFMPMSGQMEEDGKEEFFANAQKQGFN